MIKKGRDRKKILCIKQANTSAIWKRNAHSTDHLTSSSCQTGARQKKAYFLTKNILEFSGGKSQEDGPVGTKKTGQEE